MMRAWRIVTFDSLYLPVSVLLIKLACNNLDAEVYPTCNVLPIQSTPDQSMDSIQTSGLIAKKLECARSLLRF